MYSPEKYDIKCLSELINKSDDLNIKIYDLFDTNISWFANYEFSTYVVEESDEGRIDLIMDAIYGVDGYEFSDLDVLLYLNYINNPLNILAGTEIIYVDSKSLPEYRYSGGKFDSTVDDIKKAISVPNKTNRVDKNRQKFIENDYSLPPVVSSSNTSPVQITDDKIIVGGLKN